MEMLTGFVSGTPYKGIGKTEKKTPYCFVQMRVTHYGFNKEPYELKIFGEGANIMELKTGDSITVKGNIKPNQTRTDKEGKIITFDEIICFPNNVWVLRRQYTGKSAPAPAPEAPIEDEFSFD